MSNNKQSSVIWLSLQLFELFEQYRDGNFDRWVLQDLMVKSTEQAKAMHRIEILKARQNGLDNGFSNGSWDSQLYYTEEFEGSND